MKKTYLAKKSEILSDKYLQNKKNCYLFKVYFHNWLFLFHGQS